MGDSSKILQGLKSRSIEVRLTALNKLTENVKFIQIEDTQDISADLIAGLKKLISSNDPLEKITGLSTLIGLSGVANESSLNTMAVHFLQLVSLRNILSKDEEIIVLASIALGKLLSAPSTTTFELADEEFRYALGTLKNDTGLPRFAACHEIKEMAQRLPILFAVYLGEFLNVMWNALREPKDYIREAGLLTFSLALKQMETREELFEKVFSECLKGLQPENPPNVVLGSVLVLKEMLEKQSVLLLSHLQEICVIILRNKDHKTGVIKQAFLEMIPAWIGIIYSHKKFDDINSCEMLVDHVLRLALNNNKEQKAEAITILGQIATIAGNEFIRNVNQATNIINLELKKKPVQSAIFDLLKGVTKTLGRKISEHFDIGSLISTVFSN